MGILLKRFISTKYKERVWEGQEIENIRKWEGQKLKNGGCRLQNKQM